jgi:hypothetical protein
LVAARWTDHRLALDHGAIEARIWAPPRLFFVETPSARAVDLGCVYTLEVDRAGAGRLSVPRWRGQPGPPLSMWTPRSNTMARLPSLRNAGDSAIGVTAACQFLATMMSSGSTAKGNRSWRKQVDGSTANLGA